jgi:hypothetical protein
MQSIVDLYSVGYFRIHWKNGEWKEIKLYGKIQYILI